MSKYYENKNDSLKKRLRNCSAFHSGTTIKSNDSKI